MNDAPINDAGTPEHEEQRPMTDAEHQRAFGWAWDDPDREASE